MTASTLAALFIIQGLLGLVAQCLWGFGSSPHGYTLPIAGLLLCVAEIWLGIGLRRARPWARWLSLGPALLMAIGGVVVPVLVILAGGYAEVVMLGLGFRRSPDWYVGARIIAIALSLYCIFAALIGYSSLRYLRSHDGRVAYGEKPGTLGVLPHESIGAVLASALVALTAGWLAGKDLVVPARSLPGFLLTAEMQRLRDSDHAKKLAQLTGGAQFTLDSRHVVFPPSALSPEVMVLDLESGELRRTGVREFTINSDHDPIAPDGSSLVWSNTWYSLRDGSATPLRSLVHGGLGFHTPTKFLQYDSQAQKLELVDLAADRKVYSLDVAMSRRGEPGSDKPYGWTTFSQQWSADRRLYIWMNRDRSLSVLDVAAGRIRDVPCSFCMYGGMFLVSGNGEKILVPDPVTPSTGSMQDQRGGILDIASGEWTALRYRGYPKGLLEDGSGAIFSEHPGRQAEFRKFAAEGERWTMELPAGFNVPHSPPGGSVLMTQQTGSGQPMFAWFQSPEDEAEVSFATFSSEMDKHGDRLSPDGRYLLRVDGSRRIEILDVDAALEDEPALRTMDVLADERLSAAVAITVGEGLLVRWVKSDAPTVLAGAEPVPRDSDQQVADALPPEAPPLASSSSASTAAAPAPGRGGIAKCVDASGSVTFTQGTCPAGTRAVDAPAIDPAPSRPYTPTRASTVARPAATQGNELNAAIGRDGKVSAMKAPAASCPGDPTLKPFLTELTIARPGAADSVIFVTRRNKVHQTFEAARDDACREALEKKRAG